MESECYYDINLRFRIDNLQQIFEHCSLSPIASSTPLEIYTTEPFGPGSSWHIKCEHSNVGGEDYLSCVLVVGPKGYPAPITWSFTGTSSQGGVQYFRRSSTHLFTSEDKVGWGWTDTVATRTWEGFDILRRENALYVSATIRARVAPAVCPDRCLDLSYDVVTTERPGDLEFITSCGRKHAGGEPRQRRLFASSDVLREVCPQLVERESRRPLERWFLLMRYYCRSQQLRSFGDRCQTATRAASGWRASSPGAAGRLQRRQRFGLRRRRRGRRSHITFSRSHPHCSHHTRRRHSHEYQYTDGDTAGDARSPDSRHEAYYTESGEPAGARAL